MNSLNCRDREEVLALLVREMREVKSELPETIEMDMNFVIDLGLDSIDLAEYVARIEQTFGIQVSDDEWKSLASLRIVVEYVEKRLSE